MFLRTFHELLAFAGRQGVISELQAEIAQLKARNAELERVVLTSGAPSPHTSIVMHHAPHTSLSPSCRPAGELGHVTLAGVSFTLPPLSEKEYGYLAAFLKFVAPAMELLRDPTSLATTLAPVIEAHHVHDTVVLQPPTYLTLYTGLALGAWHQKARTDAMEYLHLGGNSLQHMFRSPCAAGLRAVLLHMECHFYLGHFSAVLCIVNAADGMAAWLSRRPSPPCALTEVITRVRHYKRLLTMCEAEPDTVTKEIDVILSSPAPTDTQEAQLRVQFLVELYIGASMTADVLTPELQLRGPLVAAAIDATLTNLVMQGIVIPWTLTVMCCGFRCVTAVKCGSRDEGVMWAQRGVDAFPVTDAHTLVDLSVLLMAVRFVVTLTLAGKGDAVTHLQSVLDAQAETWPISNQFRCQEGKLPLNEQLTCIVDPPDSFECPGSPADFSLPPLDLGFGEVDLDAILAGGFGLSPHEPVSPRDGFDDAVAALGADISF